jgi:UDP-glucose 4-epimerase
LRPLGDRRFDLLHRQRSKPMRTFLVTGGAGFIGSHLATALVERGDRVRVLDNFSTGSRQNLAHLGDKVQWIEGDVTDENVTARCVEGVDCIFHEAALASVPRSVRDPLATNAACVTGTVTLLDAARRAGVRRVVYAGSSSAYGDQPAASKRETDLPSPLSPYAAAKLAAEHYMQAFASTYGLETVTIRYFNVFGPRQDPTSEYSAVIPLFITAMLAGQRPTIYGDGHQSRDFTFIQNVVDGNLLAADALGVSGRTFNIANGRSTTLLELVSLLNEMLGTDITPIFADARAGDVRDSLADISQARRHLGYDPAVNFETGLRMSIAYYRSLVS